MKNGTSDHPKTYELASKLKIHRAHVMGILELLWKFTRDYCPQGDVGKYSDVAIARACLWDKDPHLFVDTLVEVGWLEQNQIHRVVVHDWHDHADDYTRKKLKRTGVEFCTYHVDNTQNVSGLCPDNSQKSLDSRARSALPVPVPSPLTTQPGSPDNEPASASQPIPADGGVRLRAPEPEAAGPVFDVVKICAERIFKNHPESKRDLAFDDFLGTVRRIVKGASDRDRDTLLAELQSNHDGWRESEEWRRDGGRYAKGLSIWISPRSRLWRAKPPDGKRANPYVITGGNGRKQA